MDQLQIYIPAEAEVKSIPVWTLPSSVLRRMGLSDPDGPSLLDSPEAVWMYPVVLRRRGQNPPIEDTSSLLARECRAAPGPFRMSFATKNPAAHRLLKGTMPGGRVSTPPPHSSPSPQSRAPLNGAAVVIYNGQVYLSTSRSNKRQTPESTSRSNQRETPEAPQVSTRRSNQREALQVSTSRSNQRETPEALQVSTSRSNQRETPEALQVSTSRSNQRETPEAPQVSTSRSNQRETPEALQVSTSRSNQRETPEALQVSTSRSNQRETPEAPQVSTRRSNQRETPEALQVSTSRSNQKETPESTSRSNKRQTPEAPQVSTRRSNQRETPGAQQAPRTSSPLTPESTAEGQKKAPLEPADKQPPKKKVRVAQDSLKKLKDIISKKKSRAATEQVQPTCSVSSSGPAAPPDPPSSDGRHTEDTPAAEGPAWFQPQGGAHSDLQDLRGDEEADYIHSDGGEPDHLQTWTGSRSQGAAGASSSLQQQFDFKELAEEEEIARMKAKLRQREAALFSLHSS